MVVLNIERAEYFSRGDTLLKGFFGFFYIGIPHFFGLLIFGFAGAILRFLAFWVILFTGQHPQTWFEYQVKLLNWMIRLKAHWWFNYPFFLVPTAPAWGLSGTSEAVDFEVPYPAELSKGKALLKVLFGWIYVGIPHGFCLIFRGLVTSIFGQVAWWILLFTGEYPEQLFDFNVGTIRWQTRVEMYLYHLTDEYPPFSGKSDEELVN